MQITGDRNPVTSEMVTDVPVPMIYTESSKISSKNLKLGKGKTMQNFSKKEMIRCYRENRQDRCKECRLSQPATRLPNGIEENIEALVDEVLDPARRKLGKPIVVNSGFRCPIHNTAVGGVYNSQHVSGQAADVHCEDNRKLAKVIVENGRFDQLILYPTFVHVSWKRQGGNRQQILRKVSNGYVAVSRKEVLGV